MSPMEQHDHQQHERQEDRQRRRRPQHFLLGIPPPVEPHPHHRRQHHPKPQQSHQSPLAGRRRRCNPRRRRSSELYTTPPRREELEEPPSLVVAESTSYDSTVPSMVAATPSPDSQSVRHHRHHHHRHHHGEVRRRVHHDEDEAAHHSHDEYDGDDHNDRLDNNRDGDGDSSHGYESDDNDNNDGSISLQSLISEERELSPGAESARSEWTLQTFEDHHQRQEQRQHDKASHVDGGGRAGGVKRSLSLASAHSNNGCRRDDEAGGKKIGKARSIAPLASSSLSLSTMVGDHSGHLNRRTLFPKLLLVCTALCVLGGSFLLSTTDTLTSFTDLYMGVVTTSTKDNHARGAHDNDNEEDWHPMFQHSKRTADVEVGVPTTTKPHNMPAIKRKDATMDKATMDKEESSASATRQDESQRRAADDVSNNGGRVGLESSSAQQRQQQKRRRAEKETLFRVDGYTRQSSNADGEGGGKEEEESSDNGGGVPNFVQGEVVQELCPATHTLLSQSLILRSSYGNIFSITTPDSTASERKRSSDGRKGKGGSTTAAGGAGDSDPQRQTQHMESTSTDGGNGNTGNGSESSTVFDRLLSIRHKRQQQQLSDALTDGPAAAAAFWASAPTNTANSTDSTTTSSPAALVWAGDTSAPTPSPTTGDPTPGPTPAAPTPNPTDDNANNQFEGDYNDIDTASESTYTGSGVETITVQTLSLRMADFKPEEETHFEVWLYTGSGDDIVLNGNDLDDDPSNDNLVLPSKGEYQSARAKFTDWNLISEGLESELIPDTDFFDNNGHVFNIGAGNTVGPLGRLDEYENMEDVTLQAREWNEGAIRTDGGMDAITAEDEVTTTYFYKIPEEKFMPLKLPKYDGKLTLFVTLDRVGLQYGYAAKTEFDQVDVTKHDYIDQTPSLDVLNGNVNLKMSVGEGVIFYPWMEEELFYQTRRFLGKIWYEARIPCEYVPIAEVLGVPDVESAAPSSSPEEMPSLAPSGTPSVAPSMSGTNITAELLVSVLVKNGELPPMPFDVQEVFEDTLLEFVKDEFGEFCPITWNEGANVVGQDLTPVGGPSSSGSTLEGRRRRFIDGGEDPQHVSKRKKNTHGGGRYLRRLLEPIFNPPKKARSRLLNTITLLDVSTVVDALYSSNACPGKTPEELAALLETYVNDNDDDFLDLLKAAHDYFKDAFGVSADVVEGPIVGVKALAVEEEDDETPVGAIVGGLLGALLLCCFCCCLPLLVIRRRKQKKSRENEIIGEDIEWAHPVEEDHFPPLGGYRDDAIAVGGDGEGTHEENSKRRKRPDGQLPMENETPPDIGLIPVPPGIRPTPDDTQMSHDYRYLDREDPDKPTKHRPFGLPGRIPGDEDKPVPNNINIYPGGDYQDDEDGPDGFRLRPIEKKNIEKGDSGWTPDHYEPDSGIHGYDRPQKSSPDIDPNWNRLPQKDESPAPPQKKLSIKQLVLQRRLDVEAKKASMRHVERVEAGMSDDEEEQVFPMAEPDSRIEDLMGRIKELEVDRQTKFQRPQRFEEESDYERWKRLNVQESELSSSDESSDDEVVLRAVERKKKKKKKKEGNDYMLHFDDLDAYNRALAVHQDAYIHKWVKVKVEKGEGEEEDGANLDDLEMENAPVRGAGDGAEEGTEGVEYFGEKGTLEGGEEDHYPAEGVEASMDDGNVKTFDAPHTVKDPGDYDSAEDDDELAKMDEELARMDEELARMDQEIAQMDDDDAGDVASVDR